MNDFRFGNFIWAEGINLNQSFVLLAVDCKFISAVQNIL